MCGTRDRATALKLVEAIPSREILAALSADARREAMIEWVRARTAEAVGLPAERIDVDRLAPDPGQLFAVIRPPAQSNFALPLYGSDIPFLTSVRAAGEHLAREIAPEPMPSAPMGRVVA